MITCMVNEGLTTKDRKRKDKTSGRDMRICRGKACVKEKRYCKRERGRNRKRERK